MNKLMENNVMFCELNFGCGYKCGPGEDGKV